MRFRNIRTESEAPPKPTFVRDNRETGAGYGPLDVSNPLA